MEALTGWKAARQGEERSLVLGRFWCFRKGFSEEFARPASRAACWQSTPPLLEEQVEESSGFCEARSRRPWADRPVRLLRKGKTCTSACRGGVPVCAQGQRVLRGPNHHLPALSTAAEVVSGKGLLPGRLLHSCGESAGYRKEHVLSPPKGGWNF